MTPRFFIGTSPSMANAIVNHDAGTAGVMVSMTQLRKRRSDFQVQDWILDSGAFTEIARHGGFRESVETYYEQIVRWASCGNLLIAVSQDYMCEPFVLERTKLTVADHQRLTIQRYDALAHLAQADGLPIPIMPVLQGYRTSDYLAHLAQYEDRLSPGAWVGVGSVCRRNGSPNEVADILRTIKLIRPDLRLHGFGIKQTALAHAEVRDLLYSADSMAWSYPRKFMTPEERQACKPMQLAFDFQSRIAEAMRGNSGRKVPRTAGAGNGQGRKPKWRAGRTKAIRVPEVFVDRLLKIAREWDEEF